MLEVKIAGIAALASGTMSVTQLSDNPSTGLYIAFGAFAVSAIGLLVALLRAMSGYGREQGEIRTEIQQLKHKQESQISATEVKLMMDNLTLKIDGLTGRMNDWTSNVTYDLRRLRESSRHALANQVARDDARRQLEELDREHPRREDLR